MRRIHAAALACSLVLVAAPPARADEGERRLRTLLLGPDATPDRATLERASPGAKAALLRIATEPSAPPFMRDRALVALGAFGGDDVEQLFSGLLAAPNTREITRHKVLLAYARAYGPRAVPALERSLEDPRPAIRLTAVEALGALVSPAALRALTRAAQRPQPAAVERALDRALRVSVERVDPSSDPDSPAVAPSHGGSSIAAPP